MEMTLAVLVGHLGNDRLEVRLPWVFRSTFVGPSEAELLDDAALHVMEHLPKLPASVLSELVLCPEVCIRKVTVETALKFGGQTRRANAVKVRLTAVCTRWATDGFWIVCLPRLGPGTFPVSSLGELKHGVPHWLTQWAKTGTLADLEAAASLPEDHLELIDLEVELPSVLPSRVPKKRKKKKKRKDEPTPPKKRTWVPAVELRSVAVNLVHRAMDGRLTPALGRDAFVDDLVQQLEGEGACILLVGVPGVGKTALIEAVACRIANQGRSLQERTDLWRVDGARLIAGMSFVGAWESRMATVVHELSEREDVLIVDDLPSLAWTGRSAQSETTMAGFLLPHLQRNELRILAECTPERLEAGRQKNPGFFSCFRVIRLDAMGPEATYRVLLQHLREVERTRNVVGSPDLLEAASALARRFGPPLAEPGRSVVVLRRFLGEVDPTETDRLKRGRVKPSHLLAHFAQETGLPSFVLEPGAARSIREIREDFARHIVGQETAVDTVVDVVAALQQGLDDPQRPVATLLFVGPTGVGKTETAKALAKVLFGSADRMLRFDMSEVQGPGALRRLVGGGGSPDGDLTRAVANQPFSVVLLDEIEKAGPQVFDLLLQVLGEGRLTNAVGRTTDFRNTVVVMTSNLGVAQSRRRTGFAAASTEADATHYRRAAREFFRPEFYNRIDHVVPFRTLGPADVQPLVQRIVGRVLSRRGLRRSGVVVQLDEAFKTWIAQEGFDPVYGARSLQRIVEQELTVPLARLLVNAGPADRGAFVEVWRDTELRMHLHGLTDDRPDPGRRSLPDSWSEVAALHTRLLEQVEQVSGMERWQHVQDERSALLARTDGLEGREWDQLDATTSMVEEQSTLLSDLEDFAEQRLASHRYMDSYSVLRPSMPNTWRYVQKTRIVTEAVPVPVDRGRTLGAASEQLLDVELRVGALTHRVRCFGDDLPFVLRFEALHDEARDLAHQLAIAFASTWSAWGPVSILYIDAKGRWQLNPDQVLAGDPSPASPSLLDLRFDAVAMAIPGLASLLAPDMGMYLDASDFGSDRLLRLVRVECLFGAAIPTLEARDAELAAAQQARRRGELGGEPLPPVVHRFGVLRPDEPLAPRLSSLAADLFRLALRRVEL